MEIIRNMASGVKYLARLLVMFDNLTPLEDQWRA